MKIESEFNKCSKSSMISVKMKDTDSAAILCGKFACFYKEVVKGKRLLEREKM